MLNSALPLHSFFLHEPISGPLLVRQGGDVRLPLARGGVPMHTRPNVYREMIRQICADYPGLPDVREMTETEIEFFYDGLRPALRKATTPHG